MTILTVNCGSSSVRLDLFDAAARQRVAAHRVEGTEVVAALRDFVVKASAPIGEPGRYLVRFTGLDSAEDYMRLSGWLQGQSVVQDIVPKRATADMVEFELQLATGLPGLRRVVDDELLEPASEGEPLTFRVR